MDPPANATSWLLIERAAAGNEEDREGFARRYEPVIRAFLTTRWRLPGDDVRVEDSMQEVFVQCFKERGALEGVKRGQAGGFRGFLYGVVRNVALMLERKWAREREIPAGSEFRLDAIETSEATLSQAFDRGWAEVVIGEALAMLDQRAADDPLLAQRFRALELRYQEGLKPADVAVQMELPADRAYQLLRGAKGDFRAALLEIMAAYHPAAAEDEIEQRCAGLLTLL